MDKVDERHQNIRQVLAARGIDLGMLVSSVDPRIKNGAKWDLDKTNEPPVRQGIRRFVFPLPLPDAFAMFQEIAPYTEVDLHSHDEEHVWHVVVSGHIWVAGDDLPDPVKHVSGEWVWVPRGRRYRFWTEEFECWKFYFHVRGSALDV